MFALHSFFKFKFSRGKKVTWLTIQIKVLKKLLNSKVMNNTEKISAIWK